MQSSEKLKALDKDKIRPRDLVTIIYHASPFHKEGTEEEVLPLLADKLIAKGYAYKQGDTPPPSSKPPEQKDPFK